MIHFFKQKSLFTNSQQFEKAKSQLDEKTIHDESDF